MDHLTSEVPDVEHTPLRDIDEHAASRVLARLGGNADQGVPVAAFDSSI